MFWKFNRFDYFFFFFIKMNLFVFKENQTLWKYGSNSSRSSLIIFGGSFQSNQTYYFKVELNNILNSSVIYTGNLLIQIEDQISMTIIIK